MSPWWQQNDLMINFTMLLMKRVMDNNQLAVDKAFRNAFGIINFVHCFTDQKSCARWGMLRGTFWARVIARTATYCTFHTGWNSTSAADLVFDLQPVRVGSLPNVWLTGPGRFRWWTALVRINLCTCNARSCQLNRRHFASDFYPVVPRRAIANWTLHRQ